MKYNLPAFEMQLFAGPSETEFFPICYIKIFSELFKLKITLSIATIQLLELYRISSEKSYEGGSHFFESLIKVDQFKYFKNSYRKISPLPLHFSKSGTETSAANGYISI